MTALTLDSLDAIVSGARTPAALLQPIYGATPPAQLSVRGVVAAVDVRALCTTTRGGFAVEATFACTITTVLGPIAVPGTSLSLGLLHVTGRFAGRLASAGPGQPVQLRGTLTWAGVDHPFATWTVPATSFACARLSKLVSDRVRAATAEILGDPMGAPERYVALVASNRLSGGSDPASVLTGCFHLTGPEAASLLGKAGVAAAGPTHVDQTAPHVDAVGAHVDVPGKHADVAPVHGDTAGVHVDVGRQHVDTAAAHVDQALPHVDTQHHVDRSAFGVHVDAGGAHADAQPHADQARAPHVDSLSAHVDTVPHIDRTLTPHADVARPHVDVSPHADAGGAHVDQVVHVDTAKVAGTAPAPGARSRRGGAGAASPHVDSAGPHGDHAGPHVDVRSPHVDVGGPTGHVDVAPHVDTAPHADATPHADRAPHVDTVVPHVDRAGGHADTALPHVDTAPHVDMRLGPAHGDATTPHVDVPGPHADARGAHADSGAGHVDRGGRA